jgi:hypothetical protein
VVNGFVVDVTITDGGTGYTNAPFVTISGGGGSGAIATASISTNGVVMEVIVENPGRGYTPITTVTISAPPPGKPPFSDGLVAFYPFNGNANDESGGRDDGQVIGATLTTDRFGKTNSAYNFDYSSANAIESQGLNIDRGLGTRTFTFWFKQSPNIYGNLMHAPILSLWDGISQSYFYIEFWQNCLQVVNNNPSPATWIKSFEDIGHPMTDGNWHQMVCVINANTVIGYIDSNPIVWNGGMSVPGSQWNLPNGFMSIGQGTGYYYDGLLDEIRVYNRVLSHEEVISLYAYEAPVPLEQPSLNIRVKTVQITMTVTPTKKYQLEASNNMITWIKIGAVFNATATKKTQDVDTTSTGRYFRLSEVQ